MILGYEEIIKTLQGFAKAGNFPHGLIFCGPSNLGKFTVALSLANYLEKGEFEETRAILQDLKVVLPNEQKNIGIDAAKEIKEFVFQKPNTSKYRMVIINDAERLTEEAQNALLKITEEPPASSLIILVLRDPESLMPTLLSRFQKINFSELKEEEVDGWLKKEFKLPAKEAKELAAASGGKPGLAKILLSGGKEKDMQKLVMKYLRAKGSERGNILKGFMEDESFNAREFLDGLILYFSTGFEHNQVFAPIWHTLLEMRRNFEYYNLNPRIHLENFSILLERNTLTSIK